MPESSPELWEGLGKGAVSHAAAVATVLVVGQLGGAL